MVQRKAKETAERKKTPTERKVAETWYRRKRNQKSSKHNEEIEVFGRGERVDHGERKIRTAREEGRSGRERKLEREMH